MFIDSYSEKIQSHKILPLLWCNDFSFGVAIDEPPLRGHNNPMKIKWTDEIVDNYIGHKFNCLTITKRLPRNKGTIHVEARCECGRIKAYPFSKIIRCKLKSCGCYWNRKIIKYSKDCNEEDKSISMNKYSQSGQDDWVLSIIGKKGYFVDLGAFDGKLFSNTLRLEEAGWDGLCVEANPFNFDILIQNRTCNVRNLAVATYKGKLRMNNEASSSQRDENGTVIIRCDTLLNIFRNYKVPYHINYISSDLERMDAEVWETFPFNEYSFGLATVEHCLYEGNNNFKERIMKVMFDNGYVLARENVECDNNPYEDWFCSKELKDKI